MDANTIMTLCSSLGFPVIMCGALAFWIKYTTDQYNTRLDKIQSEHKEEIAKVTEALNNNTLALQKLCDKMEG